jgi:hypothetical protein
MDVRISTSVNTLQEQTIIHDSRAIGGPHRGFLYNPNLNKSLRYKGFSENLVEQDPLRQWGQVKFRMNLRNRWPRSASTSLQSPNGSIAAKRGWILSLKRAKIGENTPVLNNSRGRSGTRPCFLCGSGGLFRSGIPLNMGRKRPASDRPFRCSFPDLRVEDEHDAAILIFKIQNLCYTYS